MRHIVATLPTLDRLGELSLARITKSINRVCEAGKDGEQLNHPGNLQQMDDPRIHASEYGALA